MKAYVQTETPASCVMTPESIHAYIQHEKERGVSENALRRSRRFTNALYEWLPDEKVITKEQLLSWRQNLKAIGYSSATELSYVKGINRYLDYMDCSDLRFNRGRAKNIAGMQFGYLTAIAPTGKKHRKDHIWRCQCKCGREVDCPATRLLTGNTLSCGCLRKENLEQVNKYYDGTSLRRAMVEQVFSTQAASGYTGVTAKNGKWKAYIKYKRRSISLGTYEKLEDAVKARARGKELVRKDAMGLLDIYEELHKNDPAKPNRSQTRKEKAPEKLATQPQTRTRATRSNNTSGYPGVTRKRDKWSARITHQNVTYQLGCYESITQAAEARQKAETALRSDPAGFPEWVLAHRKVGKENG